MTDSVSRGGEEPTPPAFVSDFVERLEAYEHGDDNVVAMMREAARELRAASSSSGSPPTDEKALTEEVVGRSAMTGEDVIFRIPKDAPATADDDFKMALRVMAHIRRSHIFGTPSEASFDKALGVLLNGVSLLPPDTTARATEWVQVMRNTWEFRRDGRFAGEIWLLANSDHFGACRERSVHAKPSSIREFATEAEARAFVENSLVGGVSLSASEQEGDKNETWWLCELSGGVWLSLPDPKYAIWHARDFSNDPARAIRFATRGEAEAVAVLLRDITGTPGARAVEHMWFSPSVPVLGKGQEPTEGR